MIFTGDIACPNLKVLPDLDIPKGLKDKVWISNLEGAIEINGEEYISENVVYNQYDTIKKIKDKINIRAFGLANNHITDTSTIKLTKELLDKLNINHFGAGIDLASSKEPCLIRDVNGVETVLLNFGWRSINCIEATGKKQGVNPFNKKNILSQVKTNKLNFKDAKIVVYFHWNYELELYPQPFDRELSYELIDMGVDAIIGCHAHRVQGAELYKNKPIIYGLGNWIFTQNVFWNKRLKYPEFCNLQLAFEIDWKTNEYFCHWFLYDKKQNEINYINSEYLSESAKLKKLTPFRNLSSKEYINWFKINRYQKKLLPMFESSNFSYLI